MRKFEPDFDIRDCYEFAKTSREVLIQYEELFDLVYTSIVSMAKRYVDFYKYNEQMKEHSRSAITTFGYMFESIPKLKTEHEKLLNRIEFLDEINLHEEKIEADFSLSKFMEEKILKAPQERVYKDLDDAKTYLNEQLQDIEKKLEQLSYLWQDSNFDIFYSEVADGTKELVDVFNRLATPTQNHILLNEQHRVNWLIYQNFPNNSWWKVFLMV